MRLSCKKNLLFVYLSINSIRNKFDSLKELVSDSIDILILSATKLDGSLNSSQFRIEGYMLPNRADRNRTGGGLHIFITEGVPVKEVPLLSSTVKGIEAKAIEINVPKIK